MKSAHYTAPSAGGGAGIKLDNNLNGRFTGGDDCGCYWSIIALIESGEILKPVSYELVVAGPALLIQSI